MNAFSLTSFTDGICSFPLYSLDVVYFPAAPDESQRYNCDRNSSLFSYDPQTRRIHQVGNGHCLVVNRKSYHYVASEYYPTIPVLKSIDCKRAAMNDSTARFIWGNEFRLVHSNSTNNEIAIRFIAPEDGHEWTIYIRVKILIIANQTQQTVDDLEEPWLEVIHDHTSFIQKTIVRKF